MAAFEFGKLQQDIPEPMIDSDYFYDGKYFYTKAKSKNYIL